MGMAYMALGGKCSTILLTLPKSYTLSALRPTVSQQKATKQQQQHHTLVPDSSTGLLSTSRSECITIKAPNKAALSSARIRVELQIKSAVNSRLLDYTHFISLPMSNEQTAEKLQQFQEKVGCKLLWHGVGSCAFLRVGVECLPGRSK